MARNLLGKEESKKEETKTVDIEKCIDSYYSAKENEKVAKHQADEDGKQIKKWLAENKKTEYQGKNHKVSVSTSDSVSYDDTALLKIAKGLSADIQKEIIEKVEVVNLNKVERLVIEGKLKLSEFDDAKVVKSTTKLYIK